MIKNAGAVESNRAAKQELLDDPSGLLHLLGWDIKVDYGQGDSKPRI